MIEDVLQKQATDWTADDYAQIHAYTAPFWGRSSKHWDDETRETFQRLFIGYFSIADDRTRAIAFTVIVSGIPTKEVGALRLEARSDDHGVNDLERELGLRIMLHDKTVCTFGAPCNMAIRDYIFERGLKPGPLFFNQRRPKGYGEKPLPAISTQCVQRIFSKASTAMGWHGKGQKIQWHTLAAPCDWKRLENF